MKQKSMKKTIMVLLFCLMAAVGKWTAAYAGDSSEYFSLTVNFLRQDGTAVAAAYKGEFEAGRSYPETIVAVPRFPTCAGYTPTLGSVPESKGLVFDLQADDHLFSYSFDGTQGVDDIVIDIVFVPMLNVYKVEYYHQALANDKQYDKVSVETFSGLTGSAVDRESIEASHSADGFAMRDFNPPTIAADGSTVVKVFYDRLYYHLSFDTDGAVESIATQYLPYDAPIVAVGTPSKPGYNFAGWSPAIPSTMPAGATTCTAQWVLVSENADVSIVVWGENANDDNYSYMTTTKVSAPVGSTYSLGEVYACGKTEHSHSAVCGSSCTHIHDATCYGAVGATAITITRNSTPSQSDVENFGKIAAGGLVSGKIYRKGSYGSCFLYLNGQWYRSDSSAVSGSGTSRKSGSTTYYVFNAKSADELCKHVHDDSCYACGLEEHAHDSGCTLDDSLYTLNRGMTEAGAVVKADGTTVLNAFYDRKEFSLTMNYDYSKTYGATESITAKWGATIAPLWSGITSRAGNSLWSRSASGNGPWTSLLQVMPGEDRTYYMANNSGSVTNVGGYYLQSLEDEDAYDVLAEVPAKSSGNVSMTIEDRIDIDGFTYATGYKEGGAWNGAQLRYVRNSYDLVLNNGKENYQTIGVKYEKRLGTVADFTCYTVSNPPPHPDTVPEPFLFCGWSLSPNGAPSDSVNALAMPAANQILYACWKAPVYEVRAIASDEQKGSDYFHSLTPYGSKVVGLENPAKKNYEFVGWFYVDERGAEHVFDPETMYIYSDVTLHGKWRNTASAPYVVNFVEKGTERRIAPAQDGTAVVDTTFTVTPKTIDGYFPTMSSKSITMEMKSKNSVTFEYIKVGNVPYMVRYLDESGAELLPARMVSENRLDVVTEKYASVENHVVRDAYQTRYLVVSDSDPQPEENVITFVYTPNATDIMVTTEYYINTDLTGREPNYVMHSCSQQLMAYTAGGAVTITPQKISNYVLNPSVSSKSTQNMPSPKQDLVFVFKYDPEVVTITYRDGVASGDEGILQQANVLPGSKTPPYVGANPIHPAAPGSYIFDEGRGFRDLYGNPPAVTATEDATYYAQWAGVFHVHHCTGEAPDASDAVETVRMDAVDGTFDITAPVDGEYNGLSEGCLYGGLWSDAEATKLLSYDADHVSGVMLAPAAGMHYYVREISDGYLTPKTLTVRISGKYYCVMVSAIDEPANYIDFGFDTLVEDDDAVTLYADAYDALKVTYTTQKTTQYTADDVFPGLTGKMLCHDIPLGDGEVTFKPFYATLDCVKVYGVKTRTLTYHEDSDSQKSDVEDVTPCEFYGTLDEAEAFGAGGDAVRLSTTVSPTFVLGENDTAEATIRIHVDEQFTTMTVPCGTDCTERICNPSVSGGVFVGWFRDAACTRPANLSCVTDDMEIYAGFVEDGYLQVAEKPMASASGVQRIRLVTAVDPVLTSSCGFIVSDENGVVEIQASDFYDSIEGDDATELFGVSDEFAKLICHDIALPLEDGEKKLAVTPYWIPLSGTKVTGMTKYITINSRKLH